MDEPFEVEITIKYDGRSGLKAPANHIFAGSYGRDYHIVPYGTLEFTHGTTMVPVCGIGPIRIEKTGQRIHRNYVCVDCLKVVEERGSNDRPGEDQRAGID